MKAQVIAGIVILGLGVFIVLRGMNYGYQRSVIRVGEFQTSVEEQRAIPTWLGGVAIVGGLLLVGAGALKRGRAA